MTRESQKASILAYMREHGSITVREAELELDINSPTRRITDLVRDGHPIRKEWEHRTNAKGVSKRFVRYHLEHE